MVAVRRDKHLTSIALGGSGYPVSTRRMFGGSSSLVLTASVLRRLPFGDFIDPDPWVGAITTPNDMTAIQQSKPGAEFISGQQ